MSWSDYYDYDYLHVKAFAPNSGGIYEMYTKLQDGGRRLIYVGQASDLEARLLAHRLDDEPNECLKNKVSAYECEFRYQVASEPERTALETRLIQTGRPECNIQHNS